MRSVENAECGKCEWWKMRVKEKYIQISKKLKRKNKVISPQVGITPNITSSRTMPPCADPGKAQYS